jgi:hypothetical protein
VNTIAACLAVSDLTGGCYLLPCWNDFAIERQNFGWACRELVEHQAAGTVYWLVGINIRLNRGAPIPSHDEPLRERPGSSNRWGIFRIIGLEFLGLTLTPSPNFAHPLLLRAEAMK